MIDFKALKGDTSDNVEGIKGIGEKTATDLIRQFGDVPSIYAHIDDTKGALRKKLEEGEERARRNVELVTIQTDLPIDFDLDGCRVQDFDRERVASIFRELEFRVLAQRLNEVLGEAPKSAATEAEAVECDYRLVTDAATLAEAVAEVGHVVSPGEVCGPSPARLPEVRCASSEFS